MRALNPRAWSIDSECWYTRVDYDGYKEEERAKRRKARSELNHYLRDKHIERKPCEVCGAKAEAHHDNYDEPLQVRWLCFRHHREWHKNHKNPEFLEEEDAGN